VLFKRVKNMCTKRATHNRLGDLRVEEMLRGAHRNNVVIPTLDKIRCDISSGLSINDAVNIMPRHSRRFLAIEIVDERRRKLRRHHHAFVGIIFSGPSRVQVRHVAEQMLVPVESTKAHIQPANKRDVLIDDENLLMMRPRHWKTIGMPDDSNVRMQARKRFLNVFAIELDGNLGLIPQEDVDSNALLGFGFQKNVQSIANIVFVLICTSLLASKTQVAITSNEIELRR
jgi:hypothetical protein